MLRKREVGKESTLRKFSLPLLMPIAFMASVCLADGRFVSATGEEFSSPLAADQADALFNEQQLIVQFQPGFSLYANTKGLTTAVTASGQSRVQQLLARSNARVLSETRLTPVAIQSVQGNSRARTLRSVTAIQYLLHVDDVDVSALVHDLQQEPGIDFAEPNYRYSVNSVPNDPYYRNQKLWGLYTLNMSSAWDISQGAGAVVAVIDTGVDQSHIDLAANIWHNSQEVAGNGIDDDGNGFIDDVSGWDFAYQDNIPNDVHSHGTHVAGTIAALGDNNIGVIGVAPQAHIMALKALGDTGSGSAFNIAKAIRYAADMGADVINMSLGGQGNSYTLANAIQYALERNVVVVVAAGNDNINSQYQYPANVNGVISVGALQNYSGLAKSTFSNYGVSVDVFAPGSNIYSLAPNNQYATKSGTSMAAPHVAGVVALMRSQSPQLNPAQIQGRLTYSAIDLTLNNAATGWDETFAYGMVSPAAALTSEWLAATGYPEITAPAINLPGDANVLVNGVVSVQGSTHTDSLAYYEVAIANDVDSPRQFVTLHTGYQPETDAELMSWDTSGYASGRYFIRLRSVDTQGKQTESFQQVDVDPDLKNGWPIFNSYWLGHPAGHSDGKLVARAPALIDLDNDGDLEILAVDNNERNHRTIRAWQHNGTRYGNNAFIYPAVEEIATPMTIADVDGDGEEDILFAARVVSTTARQSIFAYNKQGTLLPGFPTGWFGDTYYNEAIVNSTDDRIVAVDLTGDGNNELVLQKLSWNNTRNDDYLWQLVAVDGHGNKLPGFPIQQRFPSLSDLYAHSDFMQPVTVADWFDDGHTDLVVIWPDDQNGVMLKVFNAQGQELMSLPVNASAFHQVKNPLVTDIDNDGAEELVVQVADTLVAYTMNGQMKPGWPKNLPTDTSRYSSEPGRFLDSLIVSDVDHDQRLDLVLNGASEALVLNAQGEPLKPHFDLGRFSSRGYPVRTVSLPHLNEQVLMYSSLNSSNQLEARRFDGQPLPDWPKRVAPVSGGVAIGDIDGDGKLDAIAHTLEGFLYAWTLAANTNTDTADWRFDHGNAQQTRAQTSTLHAQPCQAVSDTMNIRGSFNSWANTAMIFSEQTCQWQTSLNFSDAGQGQFKFDTYGDWQRNFGDNNQDGIAEQNGADISVNLPAGDYLVSFNENTLHYSVEWVEPAPVLTNVSFTCHNGYTNVGDSVYVVGNTDALGQWKVLSQAQRLRPDSYPTWRATLTEVPTHIDLEWKCVIADETSLTIKQWQAGDNNQVNTGDGQTDLSVTAYLQ